METADHRLDTLKARMHAGELTIGTWITLAHPSIPEILGRAGFDWLIFDAEHSVMSTADIQMLITAAGSCVPLVRLSSNDDVQIKRVMDAGAHGVMVPQVNSAADAERAVDAVYYPPRGTRGVGLARAQQYGADFDGYRAWLDAHAIVIVMIEHIDAVANVDEILAVDGVDGFIIGPYDLSASLGRPGDFDHQDVVDAIATIRAAGDRRGIVGGVHVVEPDTRQFAAHVAAGFRFMGYTMDTRILDVVARRDLTELRRPPASGASS